MKIPSCSFSRRSGFTLVELLVVIAIIAILAAVISVAAGAAINAAKRAKASNSATNIQTAIVNYYTEYSVYPLTSSQAAANPASDVIDGTPASPKTLNGNQTYLMFALCGNINAYSPTTAQNNTSGVSNTRNIAFLTPKRGDVDTNGVVVNPFSSGTTYYYFNIAIDGDYSGVLGDSGNILSNMPDFTKWTSGQAFTALTYGLTQSAVVWGCCDTSNLASPTSSTSPSQWVHTY
jgi:prepilin-type N-terminal cleavage/methylation domain-containing protein